MKYLISIFTLLFFIPPAYAEFAYASDEAMSLLKTKFSGPVETIIITVLLFSIYYFIGFLVKFLFKIEIRHTTGYFVIFFLGYIGKRLIVFYL